MNVHLISFFARLVSLLPLSLNQRLGSLIGRIAWVSNSSLRRITEFNLRHCFPGMSNHKRSLMAQDSLRHTGRQIVECAWIWHRPVEQTRALIRETVGEQLFSDAVQSPRGVIVVSPHIGNWELCSVPLSSYAEFTFFYRSPRNPALEPLILKWRAHVGGKPASLDSGGIRHGLRVLKAGGVMGILPDQEPDRENGVFAPFFNQTALTMTLLTRLASRSRAHVIYMVSERLPKAQGWRIHYLAASDDITSDDPIVAATAVNRDVERCVAICPTQYLWDYRRFNTLSDGTRRVYPRR